MSEEPLKSEELPIGDEAESRALWARIIAYDEALAAGRTLDLSNDDTVRRLPQPAREQVFEILECLDFVARLRRSESAQKGGDAVNGGWPAAQGSVNCPPESIEKIDSREPDPLCKAGNERPTQFKIGRFEILHEIGSGGHGVVFAANDPVLGRQVAVKVPRPEFLLSKSMRQRFVAEAQAVAALDHPNVVKVFDAGLEDAVCYIAEELCDGPSLAAWIKEQAGEVKPNVAATIARGLAHGLAHAHRHGILHRDLKPANVLLKRYERLPAEVRASSADPTKVEDPKSTRDGVLSWTPKLCDFGICKAFDEDNDRTLTRTGTVMGTAAYMAPEQAAGRKEQIGPQSDIYSLGAVLYEMLIGKPPIEGDSQADVLRRVLTDDPTPVRRIRRDVPSDLEWICLKCLEKEACRRYPTAQSLADDLNRFLEGEAVQIRRFSGMHRHLGRLGRPRFSSRSVLLGALSFGICLAGVATAYWQTHRQHIAAVAMLASKQQADESAFRQAYPLEVHRAALLVRQPADATDRQRLADEARRILAKYIPKSGEADLRGFEWHYLWKLLHPNSPRANLRLLQTIKAHRGEAYYVAFSPDGRRVATASADTTARVWDVETGRALFTMTGHTHDVNCVEFSPDGKTLATASEDGTVRLWDAASGTAREILWNYPDELVGVAFHPTNGHLAAASNDGVVKIWNAASRVEVATLDAHRSKRVEGLAYSPDGRLLATTGADVTTRVWDAGNSYRLLHEIDAPVSESLAFSHDSQVLCVGEESRARVYRATTGEFVAQYPIPGKHLRSLRFLPDDSSLIATGDESATNLIDLMTGECWNPFDNTASIWGAACSPDGLRVATVDTEGKLRLWDSSARTAFRGEIIPGRRAYGTHAAISPDGRQVAVGTTDGRQGGDFLVGTLETWSVDGPAPAKRSTLFSRARTQPIFSLAFDPQGRVLAVGGGISASESGVRLLDAASGRELRRIRSSGLPQKLTFSVDGSLVIAQSGAGGSPGWELQFWSTETGRLLDKLKLYGTGTAPLALSWDGRLLATTGTNPDEFIDLIRIADRTKIATFRQLGQGFPAIEFLPDRNFLIVETIESLIIFDCERQQVVRQFATASVDRVQHHGIAISSDGATLAIPSARGIALVHGETGLRLDLLPLPTPVTVIVDLKFATDGKTLAAIIGSNGTRDVYLWQVDRSSETASQGD